MILVKFDRNWSDEFDVRGFRICTQKEVDDFESYVKENPNKSVDYYFGSNQSFEGESLKDFANSFSYSEISDAEFSMLNRLFNGIEFGDIPYFSEICGYEDEDEESDDENYSVEILD